MGAIIEIKYFNSFVLKKVNGVVGGEKVPIWNGSPGIPGSDGYPVVTGSNQTGDWAIEESRIKGGYNNTSVDYGVRAYLVEEEPASTNRVNSLIYSGIFNSRTGINNTNVFSVAEEITKSADPANGSIQKLYAEDTNLIVFQESKVSRALIDKDAIYTAEGGGSITNINTTIGTIQPYSGDFGISKDPGSFAAYGYRKYFTDKNRNVVLRLSMDGLTPISSYGMSDYFRDRFDEIDTPGVEGVIKGGWDLYNSQYVLSTDTGLSVGYTNFSTTTFDENVLGWTSFFTYNPDQMFSLKNSFYSLKGGKLWRHYSNEVNRGSFYGDKEYNSTKTSITFVFNPSVSLSKVFKTINYEGSSGWRVDSIESDYTGKALRNGDYVMTSDKANPIYSYNEGLYVESGVTYRAGFDRKENKYHAVILNNSSIAEGEVLWGNSISGIKGYFTTVTMSTDSYFTADVSGSVVNSTSILIGKKNGILEVGQVISSKGVVNGARIVLIVGNTITVDSPQTIPTGTVLMVGGTNPGGLKELFAVSSNYVESSY